MTAQGADSEPGLVRASPLAKDELMIVLHLSRQVRQGRSSQVKSVSARRANSATPPQRHASCVVVAWFAWWCGLENGLGWGW